MIPITSEKAIVASILVLAGSALQDMFAGQVLQVSNFFWCRFMGPVPGDKNWYGPRAHYLALLVVQEALRKLRNQVGAD